MNVPSTVRGLITTPFRWGAALRHARVFHPRGIVCTATLTLSTDHPPTLPISAGAVVARLSKAVGIPGGAPDIVGLALRIATLSPPGAHWDVLLASSTGPAQRLGVPLPVLSWTDARWSSLTPFRVGSRLIYLRAVGVDDSAPRGVSLDAIVSATKAGRSMRLQLEEADGTGPFLPVGELRVAGLYQGGDVNFDPTGTLPVGVTLAPEWLAALRSGAYTNSRRGRHADSANASDAAR